MASDSLREKAATTKSTGARPPGATTHTLKHSAMLTYGTGPEQLGRISNGDMKAGPESFWVDKYGQMYVCDSVNNRIKKFSPSGALLEEREMGFSATDMVVSEGGDMYVLDMARRVVEQFSPDGQKKATLQLKGNLVDTAARLRVDKNEVALQTHEQNEVILTQEGKGDLLSEVSDSSLKQGLKGFNGKRFQTLRTETRQGVINVSDENGTQINKITLPVDGSVASILYLGQDQSDNSYFQIETSTNDGIELSVYSLDRDWNVVSVIPQMPNDYSTWTAKLLEIDGSGNIYQMLPSPDGVQMNMWQRY